MIRQSFLPPFASHSLNGEKQGKYNLYGNFSISHSNFIFKSYVYARSFLRVRLGKGWHGHQTSVIREQGMFRETFKVFSIFQSLPEPRSRNLNLIMMHEIRIRGGMNLSCYLREWIEMSSS